MNRREIGFLLIGLGVGLLFSIAFCIDVLASLHSLGMIVDYSWKRVLLSVPLGLLIVGTALIAVRRNALGQ